MANFFKEYIVNQKTTGAVCPSSPYLAAAMIDKIAPSSKCIVELGPGTGAITEKIIPNLSKGCTFFALEINPVFAAEMRKQFPEATVYEDSAENIQKYLQKHELKECDAVISSLPWVYLDQQKQKKIMGKICNSLSREGRMAAYSYLHGQLLPSGKRFRKLLQQHFSDIQTKIVWKNFPPAIVYRCKK